MEAIRIINRETQEVEVEQVYGEKVIRFLYGQDFCSRVFGSPLLLLLSRIAFFSYLYGLWQKMPWTAKKIMPFIQKFHVDPTEFALPVEEFTSFNDFFIRKLKKEARPLAQGEDRAIIPADGRYLCYQNIEKIDGFVVKGKKFSLEELLQSEVLAASYRQGTMVMARLCPTDYHRYHFPCDGVAGNTHRIPGALFSVNPLAVKQNVQIFTENKRTLCLLETAQFGKVAYIEVGATFVGSINQTYRAHSPVKKGDEKGFFSFGGSSLILLFEPDRLILDEDLAAAGMQQVETKCLMGQSLGISSRN
jgi:phosphatidylserine decarboxylase